jgi:hypothetical protein
MAPGSCLSQYFLVASRLSEMLNHLATLKGLCHRDAVRAAMMSPVASPGDEAAHVCLDFLRGASQLAQPYAAHLSQLLQEEGREQERAARGPAWPRPLPHKHKHKHKHKARSRPAPIGPSSPPPPPACGGGAGRRWCRAAS